MARLEANKHIVQRLPQGCYIITIPRKMAEAMGLEKGSVVRFEYLEESGILIVPNKDD